MPLKRINTIWLWVLLLSSFGCGVKSEVSEQDATFAAREVSPTEVFVIEARKRPFEYLINTNGKVEASKEVIVQFAVSGIVSQVIVKNGQFVSKGELIGTIENRKYKLDADKAEVQLKEKKVSYDDQITGFRGQDAEKIRVIRENIRYSSGLAAAEVSFEQAKLDYVSTFLKSPIKGVVSDLIIKEGNPAKAGEALCFIHDPASLTISCEVLEADAFNISKDHTVTIQPLFENRKVFQGNVISINPRVDMKTGLVRIQLSVKNPEQLVPGMNVSVVIKVPYEKNLIVPKEAIVVRSGKQIIFTAENGLAKWNYVVTGRENGKEIEVTEGLKEGQRVIITNNLQLAHDAPVKTKN